MKTSMTLDTLRRPARCAIALTLGMFFATMARADWLRTDAGPYAYTNTANWAGGNVNGVWPATVTLTAEQDVTFDADYTLTTGMSILYDPTATLHDLRFRGEGGDRTLTLNSDLTVDLRLPRKAVGFGSGTAGQRLDVVLAGDRRIFSNIASGNGYGLAFMNNVSGSGILTKIGAGIMNFQRPASFAGTLRILEGEVVLIAAGTLTDVVDVEVGGTATRAGLALNNRTWSAFGEGMQNVINRLRTDVVITSLGNGLFFLRGNDTAEASQTVGEWIAMRGLNGLRAHVAAPNNPQTTLTVTALRRDVGAVVMLGGYSGSYSLGHGEGANHGRVFATAINGENPEDVLENGIIPWAAFSAPESGWAVPKAFATYGTYGFKPYGYDAAGNLDDHGGTEPYVRDFAAAGANDNVLTTNHVTVSGTKTIHSLTTAYNVNRTVTADTLVLKSGALIINTNYRDINPRIDFDGREGIVMSDSARTKIQGGMHNDGGQGVVIAASWAYMDTMPLELGATSTYSGPTRIAYGAVAIRTVNGIPAASPVEIVAGARLDLWDGQVNLGNNVYRSDLGSIAGNGNLTARANAGRVVRLSTGGNNRSTTFSGMLDNSRSGTLSLEKVGTGTLTLSGDNTYLDNTLVTTGGLFVDGSIASTNVTVAAGATLGGAGSIAGVVALEGSAVLSPGATNAVGTLTIQDDVTIAAGAVYTAHYDAQGSDHVRVHGTLSLPGTLTVNVSGLGEASQPNEIVLFEADTLDAAAGVGNWTVSGTSLVPRVEGNQVLLGLPSGTILMVR